MIHKGVEYTLTFAEDAKVWRWNFEIDGRVVTGKTKTALGPLAMRRVERRIDAELKLKQLIEEAKATKV
jgi:hypothetical protein